MSEVQTVICMKWGTRYGPEYVNTLFSMVSRNTKRPLRFVCFTDSTLGVDPRIECQKLPEITVDAKTGVLPWRKISLWQENVGGLSGNVLFLDVDVIITGSIDSFFDYKPEQPYCVIDNWTQPGKNIGNTSVYRFKVGCAPHLYTQLQQNLAEVRSKYPNSQTYIAREIGLPLTFWPQDWCLSFKHSLIPSWPLNFFVPPRLPEDCRVVCFTGKPDPHEAVLGQWPAPWYKKIRKYFRPAPWIAQNWQ
jgi:hypothetical protein